MKRLGLKEASRAMVNNRARQWPTKVYHIAYEPSYKSLDIHFWDLQEKDWKC